MAETPHQESRKTKETVQCRWVPEQEWRSKALYWSRSPNWHRVDQFMILSIRSRRTQSHPGISVVCSSTAKNWLEVRMDQFIATAHHLMIERCEKSSLPPKNSKHSMTHPPWPILYQSSNHWICWHSQIRTCSARRILMPHQGLQRRGLTLIAKTYSMGSCHWITPWSPRYTPRLTTPLNPIRNWLGQQFCQWTSS